MPETPENGQCFFSKKIRPFSEAAFLSGRIVDRPVPPETVFAPASASFFPRQIPRRTIDFSFNSRRRRRSEFCTPESPERSPEKRRTPLPPGDRI